MGRFDSIATRFWSNAHRVGDCLVWRGHTSRDGYGQLTVSHRTEKAHRVAFELAGGDPSAEVVMHLCDVRLCVNPLHLKAGTARENQRDMLRKMRQPNARLEIGDAGWMRWARAYSGCAQLSLAHAFGVRQSYVSMVLSGKARRDV